MNNICTYVRSTPKVVLWWYLPLNLFGELSHVELTVEGVRTDA